MKLTTKSGYTVETMARNIMAVVNEATAAQHSDGIRWYSEARSVALNLARHANENALSDDYVTTERAAGIISALSPRLHWHRNVDEAFRLVASGTCATLARSRDNALAILHGAEPMDILRGPKTRAFAVAIQSGGEAGVAVVDAWAVRAATKGKFDEVAKARYVDVAQAYEVAARRLGLKVHDCQAVAWVVQRGKAD